MVVVWAALCVRAQCNHRYMGVNNFERRRHVSVKASHVGRSSWCVDSVDCLRERKFPLLFNFTFCMPEKQAEHKNARNQPSQATGSVSRGNPNLMEQMARNHQQGTTGANADTKTITQLKRARPRRP